MKFSGKMCQEKPRFLPVFRRYAFRKTTSGGQTDPPPLPAALGLIRLCFSYKALPFSNCLEGSPLA